MPNYQKLIDREIWAFINKTYAAYPEDTVTRSIQEQRAVYNAMCKEFYVGRPEGLTVEDRVIESIPVRLYGDETPVKILYFHGGGFVVGGLNSHDDVCAEIAENTANQVISVDYRLSPEHPHPAAYDDALAISRWALQRGEVILVGDSAGANLAAAVSGVLGQKIKGQVLIYPALGGDINEGSYIEHAHAPLLSRDDVVFYLDIRQGNVNDPTLNPLAGTFNTLPPTVCFAAECDPLADDCLEYSTKIQEAGGLARTVLDKGLVHGWLRARHESSRAASAFSEICTSISSLEKPS